MPELATSVFMDVLSQVEKQIKERVSLIGVGDYGAVPRDNILIRSREIGADEDGGGYQSEDQIPGVIISPSRKVDVPPDGGENCEDLIIYFVSIQVVDSSYTRYHKDQLDSWLLWVQNLRRYFNHGNLRLTIDSTKGRLIKVLVPEQNRVDPLDKEMFYVSRLCVGAIPLEVHVLEPRDSEGRA